MDKANKTIIESVLTALGSDLPDETRPFASLAKVHGMKEAELISLLKQSLHHGIIRRYGARIKHQQAGLAANVMVVWDVDEKDTDRIGAIMSAHGAVSHCYIRPKFEGFDYNLYTMIHGVSREACEAVIDKLAADSGISCYRKLWTVKEYKKSVPPYSDLLKEQR